MMLLRSSSWNSSTRGFSQPIDDNGRPWPINQYNLYSTILVSVSPADAPMLRSHMFYAMLTVVPDTVWRSGKRGAMEGLALDYLLVGNFQQIALWSFCHGSRTLDMCVTHPLF